jgi:hypothetical protein
MSLSDICQAIQGSGTGTALRESALMFPVIESTHVIGLSLSVGLVLLLDLRLVGLGIRHATPWQIIRQLRAWYLSGFAVMFATGGLLFWAEAFSVYQSPAFRWKMLFLVLAGLNAAAFEICYTHDIARWETPESIPRGARLVGWCSLVCWTAVIGCGRWTAYRLN